MPELEVLCEVLGPQLAGHSIARVGISPKFGFLLRTPPDEMARQLEGHAINRMWRRGKFLVFDIDDLRLVINPMLGGRLHWAPTDAKAPPSSIFSIEVGSGMTLRLTDFARMARVYLVDANEIDVVPGWAELGPEADQVSLEEFQARIKKHPGELKNLLRNQAFIAGIGNAYSDEILHEARFHPMRKRPTLKPDDITGLHAAVGSVLRVSVEAIRAQLDYEPHKQDRSFMKVHMRGGEACPRCGHRIAQIKARGEITNYCRGCQK